MATQTRYAALSLLLILLVGCTGGSKGDPVEQAYQNCMSKQEGGMKANDNLPAEMKSKLEESLAKVKEASCGIIKNNCSKGLDDPFCKALLRQYQN